MSTVEMRRCSGRVLPAWHAVLLVVEGMWTWYRRNWRATAISSLLQPVLFLAAFGVGFGTLIDASGRGVQATGAVPYLMYLAPALLAVGAVQNAAFESTYPILSAFKWQRTYWAVTATPITPAQLAGGQLIWIALRLALSGAAYLLVIVLFGAVTGPGMLASLGFAVLCGMAFSAPLVAFAATQDNEGRVFSAVFRFVVMPMTLFFSAPLVAFAATQDNEGRVFSAVFRFVVMPMTLFSGTFFPISQLPELVRPLAWISPLWHGTQLARGAALGTLRLWPGVGHTVYLTALLVAGVLLARWRFQVRLTT